MQGWIPNMVHPEPGCTWREGSLITGDTSGPVAVINRTRGSQSLRHYLHLCCEFRLVSVRVPSSPKSVPSITCKQNTKPMGSRTVKDRIRYLLMKSIFDQNLGKISFQFQLDKLNSANFRTEFRSYENTSHSVCVKRLARKSH